MNERQLRERIWELEEENRQLREMLLPATEVPADWKLTPVQERIYLALAKGGIVRREAAHFAVYQGAVTDDLNDDNNFQVQLSRMRKKLAPFGIEILNHWGRGYEIKRSEIQLQPFKEKA